VVGHCHKMQNKFAWVKRVRLYLFKGKSINGIDSSILRYMAPYVVLNNPYILCNSLPDLTIRGFMHETSWRQGRRLDF
jgi:hypothetical protein